MKTLKRKWTVAAFFAMALICLSAIITMAEESISPTQLLWGDTHLHNSLWIFS